MNEEKKYPKVIVSAFIFNEKDELLLIKQPKWNNTYGSVGGKMEIGETFEQALKREVKEEVNLDIENIESIDVINGLDLRDSNGLEKHFIFLDYIAQTKNYKDLKLNSEASGYKWMKLDKWLKLEVEKFTPYVLEVLQKIQNKPEEKQEDFESLYRRALADYQNLIKRTAKEKEDFSVYAKEQFLMQVLPIYDNLKVAIKYSDENNHDSWLEGVRFVVKQFKDALSDMGVEEIKTEGEKFDPNIMEAIEGQGEIVKKEAKPGYKLNNKVIIAPKVILE